MIKINERSYKVTCDICGSHYEEQFDPAEEAVELEEIKAEAEEDGWIFADGLCFCGQACETEYYL